MNIFHAGLYGWLLLILILSVSSALSFLLNRNNGITGFKKAVLVLLRTASLFCVISLLLNPFITLSVTTGKTGADIILIDNSLSMNLENRYRELQPASDEVKKHGSNVRMFAFGSGLLGEIKSGGDIFTGSEFRTYSTDLAAALEELYPVPKDFSVNTVTVISDGIINQSGSLLPAAKKFGVPFYYYLIGDTVRKNDVLINKVFYNKQAFAGSVSTVKVLINSFGYSRNLNVNLFGEGILMQTKNVLVNTSESEYTTEFKVTSGFPGSRKYTVRIDTLDNEITVLNNSRDFFIKYYENKFKVLVIAGSPGEDFSAFRQSLSKLENFSADFFVGKSPDTFYEGTLPSFDGYSAVFLFGFPLANTDKNLIEKTVKDASERNLPVIFFNSSNTGYENLKELEKLLPFTVSGSAGAPYTSMSRMLPFDAPDEPEPIRKISALPPAVFLKGAFIPKPGADVLAVTTSENEPSVILFNGGTYKSAAFLGSGIYKWTLNNSGETENQIRNLAAVLFNLALGNGNAGKFYLSTDKDCYAYSEPVEIKARTVNAGAGNFSVRLKITGRGFAKETDMEKNGANSFVFRFTPDSLSDFTAEGRLFSDNQPVAGDAVRFSCGNAQEEYILTKPDDRILKSLSANTGGSDIRTLGKSSFEKHEVTDAPGTETKKILVRDSAYYLLFIIFLLSLEWFLRKRFNLP
ncbi:MAG: hypothetical protein LWX07_01155 [Bacteroidetes bacterium]|nr:hypothetical protein [Bacteroidota bacterium]